MWSSKPENLVKIQAKRAGGHNVDRYAVDTSRRHVKVACTCGTVVEKGWGRHETYLSLLQDAWRSQWATHGAASR